MNREKASVEW